MLSDVGYSLAEDVVPLSTSPLLTRPRFDWPPIYKAEYSFPRIPKSIAVVDNR
jgi:hypothetical protein